MQNLVVLGATGTVGRNTLDVARRHADRLRILALTAHRDAAALLELCREFKPQLAVLGDPAAARDSTPQFKALGCELLVGAEGLSGVASHPQAHQVMSAIVGAAGLLPTLAAVRAGKRVLIANKEPLVMAGNLLMNEALHAGATLIPIDSEHNAIFQCLPHGSQCGIPPKGVAGLMLTASGGPFRETPLAELASVTPAQAVRHPNWVMGRKISVDSATMMNKGLEVIEAAMLYRLPPKSIRVVIHPESVIHSLVEYVDGSMLAQLGAPDMRVPIAHALAWPERFASGVEALDLALLGQLRFAPVEERRYPCLALARQALAAGGHAPNILNAANEIAVEAFLNGQLGFTRIAGVIGSCLDQGQTADLPPAADLDAGTWRWTRGRARGLRA